MAKKVRAGHDARVDLTVEATKAAIAEGIVPGGGVAQLRASQKLLNLKGDNADEQVGVDIVRESLEEPARWLAKNSGADDGWVVRKVMEANKPNFGFDALNMNFGNMLAKGILDPVKVTRTALQNAASVASMVLTTEVLITDLPEKEDKAPPMPGGGGGMPGGMGM